MALRTARLLRSGSYVNLGIGMPTLVGDFLFDADVTLHAENGILGYGAGVDLDRADPDLYNAGGQLVTALPGASFFDSVSEFEMARGGHVDTVVLGSSRWVAPATSQTGPPRRWPGAVSAARWIWSPAAPN